MPVWRRVRKPPWAKVMVLERTRKGESRVVAGDREGGQCGLLVVVGCQSVENNAA